MTTILGACVIVSVIFFAVYFAAEISKRVPEKPVSNTYEPLGVRCLLPMLATIMIPVVFFCWVFYGLMSLVMFILL